LMETDLRNGAVTTFTLTPKGSGTSVRIETRFPRSPGIRGLVESLLVPGMLCRLYRDELTNLETYARRAL
jgi:hypothetical protein